MKPTLFPTGRPGALCAALLPALLWFASVPAHAITVTPTTDATLLVDTLLGTGVTLVGTPTLISAPQASGTFTDGLDTGIGIAAGIVLTTGSVNLITNSNTSDDHGAENGLPGDAQLTALAGQPTFDATVLTFDFETATGDLFFDFVFASEEYNEFVGSFNDVFAFFVNGTNIALVPGTTDPVSINTVNATTNPGFYNNNDPSNLGTPTPFAFSFDGFTTVFTASATGLGAGVHTIKLAIADAGDSDLDSAVFIKAGSFTPGPMPGVPDAGNSLLLGVFSAVALSALRRGRRKG